jgi:hypothetical protein
MSLSRAARSAYVSNPSNTPFYRHHLPHHPQARTSHKFARFLTAKAPHVRGPLLITLIGKTAISFFFYMSELFKEHYK